jgi:hypothetical protein
MHWQGQAAPPAGGWDTEALGGDRDTWARRRHRGGGEDGSVSGGGGWRPRPGWYAYRASAVTGLPAWPVEVALAVERPAQPDPGAHEAPGQAILLLRAPARTGMLASLSEAAAQVEVAAGIRPAIGTRLRMGCPLPGLTPVAAGTALAHLRAAGMRGLPPPVRRRQPGAAGIEPSWRSSAGSVLTCEGPCGTSAQAVIAVRGFGSIDAITPPPGGALVLRAWRARHTWGLACGLVLGATAALGLGREAGRVAAGARAAGWQASVLIGPAAAHLALAGDPHHPPPQAAGHAASGAEVADLLVTCLSAGDLERPSTGSRGGLP